MRVLGVVVAGVVLVACNGSSGSAGPVGPSGPPGLQGIQGPAGVRGEAGPQGLQGVAGPQGVQGVPGPQGVQGLPGAQGPVGAKGLTWRGTWSPLVTYAVDEAVESGGSAWIALGQSSGAQPPGPDWQLLAAKGDAGATGAPGPKGDAGAVGPQGPQGVTGPTGAKGLNWRGSYSLDAYYAVDDVVEHQGTSFVAVAASLGAEPGTAGAWQVLASAGALGLTGPSGPAGEPGPRGAEGPTGPPGGGSSAYYVEQDAYVGAHSGLGSRAVIPGTQVTIPSSSAPAVADLDAFGGAAIIGGGSGYLRCQVNVLLDGVRIPGIAYYLLPIPTGFPEYISHQMTPFAFLKRVTLDAGVPHTIALELDSTLAGGAYCYADTLEPYRARFRVTVR